MAVSNENELALRIQIVCPWPIWIHNGPDPLSFYLHARGHWEPINWATVQPQVSRRPCRRKQCNKVAKHIILSRRSRYNIHEGRRFMYFSACQSRRNLFKSKRFVHCFSSEQQRRGPDSPAARHKRKQPPKLCYPGNQSAYWISVRLLNLLGSGKDDYEDATWRICVLNIGTYKSPCPKTTAAEAASFIQLPAIWPDDKEGPVLAESSMWSPQEEYTN